MRVDDNITLTGFMGTGKTTVGRLLAQTLEREFVDMDAVIEARQGRPISRIFAESGEPFFRDLERGLAAELAQRRNLVIAAGGGVVLDRENLHRLAAAGPVICLTADAETILRRTGRDSGRPLLHDAQPAVKIRALLAQRAAFYAAVPLQVNTGGLPPEQVVRAVLDALGGRP